VIEALPAIAAHLGTIKPESAAIFETNAAAYTIALQELDTELTESFAAIPAERRVLVVFHDAYTYFAARYDFEVIGVVLKNPDAEISAQEVVELQGIIDANDVPVIFAEPQFNTDILQVFVEENGVAIGELLTDSFGDRVDSYLDLMRYNRDSLVTHLA